MKGAREYSKLFKTGQYNRFYITSGSHARGATFHIQILPKEEKAKPNGENNLCLNSNAVEVYGVVSGNPGWTESYGWLHKGKWQEDFNNLIASQKYKLEVSKNTNAALCEKSKQKRLAKEQELLDNY